MGVLLVMVALISNPIVLKGDGHYIAGITVETNTGPMVLTTWHAIKPYYHSGRIHFKVLPGEYYCSIIEYNDTYDVCWLRPHVKPDEPDRIGKVYKNDIVVQDNVARSRIYGVAGYSYSNVQSANPSVKWKSVQLINRTGGGTFYAGCSGSPVYKDKLLVGMMVGYSAKDGNLGYFVPMGSLLNKNGEYKETKTQVATTKKAKDTLTNVPKVPKAPSVPKNVSEAAPKALILNTTIPKHSIQKNSIQGF